MNINIRKGTKNDFESILALINELAFYEKAADEVSVTMESMEKDASFFDFLVAEKQGKIVGTAIYFNTYSTWKGRVLYLEDLVVTYSLRRQGIGHLLFDALVVVAQKMDAQRLSWQVLDWNSSAIAFYKKINANFDGEWINCKLTASQIKAYQSCNTII